jgi:FlaA1/EpsC-like NDP-sugar epimerase
MGYHFTNRNFYLMLGIDAVCFALALLLSTLIRFDFIPPAEHWQNFWTILPWAVSVKLVLFFAFGLYKGMWRYSGLYDLWRMIQACVAAEVVVIAVMAWLYRFEGYSRGVFVIDGMLTLVLAGGMRMVIRTWYGKNGQLRIPAFWGSARGRGDGRRCLILGAGNAGEQVLRELMEKRDEGHQAIGFLDDNPQKIGRSIHGLPVIGPVQGLGRVVQRQAVDEVLIAMPSATGPQMRRVVGCCEQAGVRFKTIPGISELIDGRVSISQFREVKLQDLLGRKQVELDFSSIASYVQGKVVLITGAGGSIGSELVRQVVRFQPRLLILVDHAESALYAIEMELWYELKFDKHVAVLGRVQDDALMNQIFAQYRPHVVFHAAAYKHVPMLENNPWEAVFNNVMGSKVVMAASSVWEVQQFVLVSTDKAVRPTNVMGASKRLTELLMQAMPPGTTRYMAVRFGNVLGSAGSVIPLFQRQIQRGGPVTVTHPDMTRFFMTIPEACQLIIQAGGMGKGGEIFVLNMGEPVRIQDMARDLIRLSGRVPDKDIQITFTGVRPGEKLFEELITQDEGVVETDHKDIMVLRPDQDPTAQDCNLQSNLPELVEKLIASVSRLNGEEIKARLKAIVPEYKRSSGTTVVTCRDDMSLNKEPSRASFHEDQGKADRLAV